MKSCALKKSTAKHLPLLNDFCPLYTTARPWELEACVAAVKYGAPLPKELVDKPLKWVMTVCETALSAEAYCDRFIQMSFSEQLAFPIEGVPDFALAAIDTILMESSLSGPGGEAMDKSNDIQLAILDSETASPLIDYAWMFGDVVQYHIVDDRGIDPVYTLKRAAAHRFKLEAPTESRDERMLQIFSHIGGVHMDLDSFSEAIRIYSELIRYDPTREETLLSLAEDLAQAGCFRAAVHVGDHLIKVLDKGVDGQQQCLETMALIGLWAGFADRDKKGILSEHILSLLADTLSIQAPGHTDIVHLTRAAIPDIDDIPVKRPEVY